MKLELDPFFVLFSMSATLKEKSIGNELKNNTPLVTDRLPKILTVRLLRLNVVMMLAILFSSDDVSKLMIIGITALPCAGKSVELAITMSPAGNPFTVQLNAPLLMVRFRSLVLVVVMSAVRSTLDAVIDCGWIFPTEALQLVKRFACRTKYAMIYATAPTPAAANIIFPALPIS